MAPDTYDIAIVGAGPAGSTAAYLLARHGLSVVLLDKAEFPRDKTCGDGLTPRAVKVLGEIDALDKVAPQAFRCNTIILRHSETVEVNLNLSTLAGLPNHVLVLPRLALDEALRQHALAAGAHFISQAKVENITRANDGTVQLQVEGRPPVRCALAIVATGANTKLLRDVGLLTAQVPANLAARCYFENVEGLDASIVMFFDQMPLPGYGWVFPTGPASANIGCGVFFDDPVSQATRLRALLQGHPYLTRILKNARQVGPIKGYPLRTDFSPAHSGNDWILVAGESAGLVNPITGEGIDYAMESAQLAAQAILAGWKSGPTPAIARRYRAALSKKFRYQLALNHLAQKVYLRAGMLDRLLKRAQQSQYLRQAILDACFGSADPAVMISPRTLWEVLRP